MKKLRVLILVLVMTVSVVSVMVANLSATGISYETPEETYEIEIGMYVQELENGRRFESSIPNGTSTTDGVLLKIPVNTEAFLEKDGINIDFDRTKVLEETGSYILTLKAPPIADSKEAYGIFKFRILEPLEVGSKSVMKIISAPRIEDEVSIVYDSKNPVNLYIFSNDIRFLSNIKANESTTESVKFEFPNNIKYVLRKDGHSIPYINKHSITETGSYNMTIYAPTMVKKGERAIVYYYNIPFEIKLLDEKIKIRSYETPKETYEIDLGMYVQEFKNGRLFKSTIPNGMNTSDGVLFDIPTNIDVSMEKDGINIDFERTKIIDDNGDYTLVLGVPSIDGVDKLYGIFKFRIIESQFIGSEDVESIINAPKVEDVPTIKYDSKNNINEYTFSNYKRFYSNVKANEIYTESVSFNFPNNLQYVLKKDNNTISYENKHSISEPGIYNMIVFATTIVKSGERAIWYYIDIPFEIQEVFIEEPKIEEPKIEMENLSQTYYEDKELYAQKFSNGRVFFTNVPNGGLVEKAVILDIPSNLSYTLERDGYWMSYKNQQNITKEGSYFLTIKAPKNSVDKSSSEIYSTFSFKILENASIDEDEFIESDENSVIDLDDDLVLDVFAIDNENVENEIIGEEQSGINKSQEEIAQDEKSQDEISKDEKSEDETSKDETVPDEKIETIQSYDKTEKRFIQSIDKENYFKVNIPVQMITTEPVKFDFSSGIDIKLSTIDGEEKEWQNIESGKSIDAIGDYIAKVTFDTEKNKYSEFKFKIINDKTNELFTYITPVDYKFSTIKFNGKEVKNAKNIGSIQIKKDGKYYFELESKFKNAEKFEIGFTVDTIAPTLDFEGFEDGKVTSELVTYSLNDKNDKVKVKLNDDFIKPMGNKITKNGEYVVTVTDEAGNFTEYKFEIPYKISGLSILVIFLFICAIAGVLYYFKSVRKTIPVR